jgi:hypothetical protein
MKQMIVGGYRAVRPEVLTFNTGFERTGLRCEGGHPWGSAQVVIW